MSEEYGLIHNHMLGEESETTKQSKYQDYAGFIFNGKHSSDLGIVRTSNGSRFDENLLPTIQDKTVQVPGGDGTYFFGSYYTQKQFTIPFAFSALTEEKFLKLKAWLGDKKVHDLIFDEAPYKVYKAKVTGSATIKHIPFMEKDPNSEDDKEVRIYKGEGSIQFTCHQPFARSRFKFLKEVNKKDSEDNEVFDHYEIPDDELTKEHGNYSNIEEWKNASGIKPFSKYGDYDILNDNSINLYNPGHIDSHFKLKFEFVEYKRDIYEQIELEENDYKTGEYYIYNNEDYSISLEVFDKDQTYYFKKTISSTILPGGGMKIENSGELKWSQMTAKQDDSYLVFNSKLNLIEGYGADNKKTGNLYNEYITEGAFFKIPMGESVMSLSSSSDSTSPSITLPEASIEYDYYYL